MIKILQINSGNFGSTGNIMLNISKVIQESEYSSYVAYPNSRTNNKKDIENSIVIGNILERNIHLQLAYITGYNGCFSVLATKKFLRMVDEISPDVIHLHNLHNCYINLDLLFKYIKLKNIPIVWTLHDCWAFTGQCPYFTSVKCEKWKTGCFECPQYREYPASRVDKTKIMYSLKKKWFTGIKNLTIVTPSIWLADVVKESFLGDYPIKVINNGIDLNIFQPRVSDFREMNGLQNKFIVLGVASPFSKRKGLDTFIELSKHLDDSFKIVLVGLTNEQIKLLPDNILGFTKTTNATELAEIYSASDVFVNPTLEDNFPTTNLEAIACGTPVITFNTGGSPESIDDNSGIIVETSNNDELISAIFRIFGNNNEIYRNGCLKRAEMLYNQKDRFEDYSKLYYNILRHGT